MKNIFKKLFKNKNENYEKIRNENQKIHMEGRGER